MLSLPPGSTEIISNTANFPNTKIASLYDLTDCLRALQGCLKLSAYLASELHPSVSSSLAQGIPGIMLASRCLLLLGRSAYNLSCEHYVPSMLPEF